MTSIRAETTYADGCHAEMDCPGYVLLRIMHFPANVICLIPAVESPQTRIQRERIC